MEEITRREVEITKLVAEGLSNKEIGVKLFIAEGTVKNHIGILLDKLEAKNRASLVYRALQRGIIDVENHTSDDDFVVTGLAGM